MHRGNVPVLERRFKMVEDAPTAVGSGCQHLPLASPWIRLPTSRPTILSRFKEELGKEQIRCTQCWMHFEKQNQTTVVFNVTKPWGSISFLRFCSLSCREQATCCFTAAKCLIITESPPGCHSTFSHCAFLGSSTPNQTCPQCPQAPGDTCQAPKEALLLGLR